MNLFLPKFPIFFFITLKSFNTIACALNLTFYSNPFEWKEETEGGINFAKALEVAEVCAKYKLSLPEEIYDFFTEKFREEESYQAEDLIRISKKLYPYELQGYGVIKDLDSTSCSIDLNLIPPHVKTIKVSYE